MKKVLPLIALLLSVLFAAAQSITLNFAAVDQNGNPHDFTSVKIENLTRGWQHTLNYPETTLEIPVSVGVGELEEQGGGLRLAGPNPFKGTAYAELQLTEAGPVELMAMQLDGKLVARCDGYLPSGVHRIQFDAASPQMYLLVAKTNQGSHVVKLMNIGNGIGNGIVLEKSVVSGEKGENDSRELGYCELGDEMRFTAYDGEEHSEELTLNLFESGIITLTFNTDTPEPTRLFSVSESTRVRFSQGNLQYQPSTGIWRFAENQLDFIGADNEQVSSPSYTGWIDLFGWGTGDAPTMCSQNDEDYDHFTDWGVNPISNGGNTANQWRTLTSDEWSFLLFNRTTSSGIRYVKAMVNGIKGVIILPDDWNASFYALGTAANQSGFPFTSVSITQSDWTSIFEAHGAVFLPVAGSRNGTSFVLAAYGNYFSSTPDENNHTFTLLFGNAFLYVEGNSSRSYGSSVRLVADE